MIAQTDDYKQRYVKKHLPIKCIENDSLVDLDIKDNCFALLIIHEGSVSLQVGENVLNAMAPCLVCLDETQEVKLRRKRHLVCDSIYFHPIFLNINMTFERVHSPNYEALANIHDLFLLSPFTGYHKPVLPMLDENQATMRFLFSKILTELKEQPDWYYPCRSRSYFIEIMLLLERIYDFVGGRYVETTERTEEFNNPHLQKAVAFIESHHAENITLQDIVKSCSVNYLRRSLDLRRLLICGITVLLFPKSCWSLPIYPSRRLPPVAALRRFSISAENSRSNWDCHLLFFARRQLRAVRQAFS